MAANPYVEARCEWDERLSWSGSRQTQRAGSGRRAASALSDDPRQQRPKASSGIADWSPRYWWCRSTPPGLRMSLSRRHQRRWIKPCRPCRAVSLLSRSSAVTSPLFGHTETWPLTVSATDAAACFTQAACARRTSLPA